MATKRPPLALTNPVIPTVEEIVDLHDAEVRRSADTIGILNRGSLEAAVDRARFGPFEGNGTSLERAAFVIRGIAQDHPFADGNKRTAFAAGHLLLGRNGLVVEASTDDVVSFMLAVAKIELDLDGILAWLARHVETLKEAPRP